MLKVAVLANTKESIKHPKNSPVDFVAELDSSEVAKAYVKALKSYGYKVLYHEGNETLIPWLKKVKPDICFNTCEGISGESREAYIPAILDMLSIPYTGPSPLAAAITQDKPTTKKILDFHNILTPKFQIFNSYHDKLDKALNYPLFVKPKHEGTGKGIKNNSVVYKEKVLRQKVKEILNKYKQPALVEEFIEGRDLTCGLVGNRSDIHVFPVSEIDFSGYKHGLLPIYGYDQKVKYAVEYKNKCPAPLTSALTRKVKEVTCEVFKVTGCRDYARVDFRLDKRNRLYVIEINSLPGITPISDLSLCAYTDGWKYERLVHEVLLAGIRRLGLKRDR